MQHELAPIPLSGKLGAAQGEDFYTRRQDPEHYKDKLIARLTKLGYTVTVQPAEAA